MPRNTTSFAVLFGCLAVLAAVDGLAQDARTRIVLEPAEAEGTWRATYHLDSPASTLRFQRPASFFREGAWTVTSVGWSLRHDGEEQLLVAEPGYDTPDVTVEFEVFTDHLSKEYEFFTSFTDGSVAIYTGHLYATSAPLGTSDDDATFLHRVELVVPAGQHGIVQGRRFTSSGVWEDEEGDGTYVYFGSILPIETADMIAIVDPGAPQWLVDRLHTTLPSMFALYAEGFAEPLPWKPMVLFAFDDADVPGTNYGGGTLTGLVQMSAQGRGWREQSTDNSVAAASLFAHESAHLWNGQLHGYRDMADSWMHEGSADAFATLVLRRQGILDDEGVRRRRTKAVNACAAGLQKGSLVSSPERGQFEDCYSCGEVIAAWSAAALPGGPRPDGLFDVWRAVFAHVDPADGRYDRDAYFDALVSRGVHADDVAALRGFIDGEWSDPASALIELMARAGIELERAERPVPEDRRDWGRALMTHLMGTACGGRYSFHAQDDGLRTSPIDDCAPFTREMLVVSIEGQSLATDADLAFAVAALRCREGAPVTLTLTDGAEIIVPCDAPVPARPAPLVWRAP